jgi:hypothetical protein
VAGLVRELGFDVAALANNHVRDFGDAAVIATLEGCAKSGLKTVGAGRSVLEAAEPLVVTVGEVRVGLIAACEEEFSAADVNRPGSNPIDPLRLVDQVCGNRDRWDVLVVLLHAGRELYPYPTPRQRTLCQWIVRLGASAVICQHSHCPGCYERVGTSVIVYGQGNFLFDPPNTKPSTWFEGFAVSLEFEEGQLADFELLPFRQPDFGSLEEGASFLRLDSVTEEVNRRSREIQQAGFVEMLWEEHCRSVASTYYLWLSGTRWHDRLRFQLARLLRREFRPFSKQARRRYSLLIRCDTHREILETILAEQGSHGNGSVR